MKLRHPRGAIVVSLLLVAGLAAACGTTETDTVNQSKEELTGAAADGLAIAQESVEQGYEGTFRGPPGSGPAAQAGKDVWIISCGQAFAGCSAVTAGVQEAGTALGWDMTMVDGKGDPLLYNQAIRQAIAAEPDGIMNIAIDCPIIKASLEEAKDAGIPVVAPYAIDCSDPLAGGTEPLFTQGINYGTETIAEYFEQWGALQADYVTTHTNGQAKIVALKDAGYIFSQHKYNGFEARLAEVCPGCEIVDSAEVPVADLSSGGAAQKAQTLLAQHTDANVLITAYDAQQQAIASSMAPYARRGVLLMGGEGYPANIDLIKQGTQSVAVAMPVNYIGWAGSDTMNRIFAGETDFPDQGMGFQIVDQDNNLPDGNEWQPEVDYKGAYEVVFDGGAE